MNDFRVTTDEKGKAWLRGLPINKMEGVTVRQQDTQPQLFRTHHHELETVTLQPTGRVVGNIFVANPKAARPELMGKRVSLMSSGKQDVTCHTWTTVDARGEFAVNGMMAGNISASLAMGDSPYQPYPFTPKRLAVGEELDMEIVVAEAVLVRGRLVTEDTDEPVEKTRIAAFQLGDIGHHQSKDATSDQEGYFRLYLHPGSYQVQAYDMVQSKHAIDYSYPPSIQFSLKEGVEEFDAPDIRFPPVRVEIGKLIDGQGKPIANRRVALLIGDSNHPIKSGNSDENGALKIRTWSSDLQISDQATRWVLYPKEKSAKVGDVRDYPSLRLESDSPLILVSEQPDA
ncbi:MAG: carboxypeptidase-like regulatory domain-containing protein [Pirellula sp.]